MKTFFQGNRGCKCFKIRETRTKDNLRNKDCRKLRLSFGETRKYIFHKTYGKCSKISKVVACRKGLENSANPDQTASLLF